MLCPEPVKKPFMEIMQPSEVFYKISCSEGLQACNFMKRRLQCRCFLVNIAKFLRTSILKNIC